MFWKDFLAKHLVRLGRGEILNFLLVRFFSVFRIAEGGTRKSKDLQQDRHKSKRLAPNGANSDTSFWT